MGSPAFYPISVRIGDTESVTVTLQESDSTPVDITGRSYAAQIRATADSSTVIASFTCAITNAAAGQFACTLSAATTGALAIGTGVWDLQETNGTTVTTILAGPVRIDRDITR